MGHVWDENLEEYNNPLPRWWMWLFWITLAFGVIYLVLFPGLGSFAGVLKLVVRGPVRRRDGRGRRRGTSRFSPSSPPWTSRRSAADPQAREMGQRLFLNYCAQCHASDARGLSGFPNLHR